jgi:NadR type nicotinamide-nucleotide adenylyltransferase
MQTPAGSRIKKVCVIGPECTGKTELSQHLASYYQTNWVDEYARAYLQKLGKPYQQADLVKIAHGQLRMEDEWARDTQRLLICDTNLIVIKIWSEFKYGHCDREILSLIDQRHYDLYLLTYIDIPWQDDPLREHPGKREELFRLYEDELKKQATPVVHIKGERSLRRQTAIEAIDRLLAS